jgi:hypothetical protein
LLPKQRRPSMNLEKCPDGHDAAVWECARQYYVECVGSPMHRWQSPCFSTEAEAGAAWNRLMRARRAMAEIAEILTEPRDPTATVELVAAIIDTTGGAG